MILVFGESLVMNKYLKTPVLLWCNPTFCLTFWAFKMFFEHVGPPTWPNKRVTFRWRILLRTVEPTEGSVTIDGVDIQKVGLARLRSSVTAIPQDVVESLGQLGMAKIMGLFWAGCCCNGATEDFSDPRKADRHESFWD
jgi:hypothetical protein